MVYYYNLESCERSCLTSCYAYLSYFRCKYNLTFTQIIVYISYLLLLISVAFSGFVIYGRYKRRQGFTKQPMGPCCYKYVRDPQQQHEMRQVIYIGDQEGAITEVGSNFVLVPTNQAGQYQQQQIQTIQPPNNGQQPKNTLPNTAPQF